MIASRRGDWQDLLAATFVTVAVAIPVVLASAAIEMWVFPQLLDAIKDGATVGAPSRLEVLG